MQCLNWFRSRSLFFGTAWRFPTQSQSHPSTSAFSLQCNIPLKQHFIFLKKFLRGAGDDINFFCIFSLKGVENKNRQGLNFLASLRKTLKIVAA